MERVSDEWLDEQISLYDHLGDEISDLGKERCAALVELRDRRAADDPEDAEYASYEASKAQAEQLAAMTAGQLERLGSGVMFELMRRAAEREQAEPPLFDKDITNLTCYYERYIMDNWTDTPDERCRMADATIHALIELQSLRAAEREQPAPTEPQPKWERRLRKIDGSLRYNAKDDQWEVWWCPPRGDVMDTVDFGKTPKAAVEAAWKAWKEERGE